MSRMVLPRATKKEPHPEPVEGRTACTQLFLVRGIGVLDPLPPSSESPPMQPSIFARDRSLRPPAHRLWIEAVSAITPMPRRVRLAAGRAAPRGDGHPV